MVLAIISIFFPAAILGALALMGKGAAPLFLRAGAGACVIVGLIAWRFVGTRPLGSALTGVPAAVGFVFLWLARLAPSDPVGHVALGLLILVPMSLFAGYALIATGAPSLRRAQRLTRRLASRKDLPLDIIACRQLPEMKELRESLRNEAAPALSLLVSDRPAVRLVALVALEYRRHWRVGEPNVILTIARSDPQPEVRAAAVLALAGVQQRLVLEEMAECLRDPAPIVRSSAVDAVLWDCERRWIWARHAVHEALADPRFQRDGALILSNGKFSDAAVNDLVAWATEAGILGQRATQTLARHYSQRLAEGADPLLVGRLSDHVADHRASAILRIELAHLLRQHMPVPRELLVKLLDPANPSPLRLLAVEQLLQAGPDQRAIDALREIAHQPNRELAIQAAVVVQRYLRVDLGLELGQPTPALHTRQAADVTRRVIQWATQQSKEQAASAPIAPPEPEPELEPPPAPLKPKSSVPLWDSLLSPPAATKPDTHLPPPEKFAPLEWD
jgi:hypothetical protein